LPASGTAPKEAASPASVSHLVFPADFARSFTEYRRQDEPETKTISRSFANAMALQAAREGRPLPEGSAIYVANFSARLGADGQPVLGADGRLVPDKALSYSAMESGRGWGHDVPALLRNGNWNYGLFNADGSSRIGDLHSRCLACHKPKEQDSFVFTLKELQAKAQGR
jgi:Cytochrome P460